MKTRIIYLSFVSVFLVLLSYGFYILRSNSQEVKWNPHAGLIPSYINKSTIIATSNTSDIFLLRDNDYTTAWQSGAPLPEGYVSRSEQNILMNRQVVLKNKSTCKNCNNITDGNLETEGWVRGLDAERRELLIPFKNVTDFFAVSIKAQTTTPINLYLVDQKGNELLIGHYNQEENFTLKRIEKVAAKMTAIKVSCEMDFGLFELAVLSELPSEYVIFDFGEQKKTGTIKTKHWAGEKTSISIKVFLSNDQIKWDSILSLESDVAVPILSRFPEQTARYLKIEYVLTPKDWNKVFLWEVDAWDKYGPYGEKPIANQSAVSLRELLGVNGYWSWGTDQYSDQLKEGEGPRRFSPVVFHARNYHDMTWDLNAPGEPIDFSEMPENGTPAKDWLNWDREYKNWSDAGLAIQASLQFYRFTPGQWQSPENDAFQYARSYVQHFGPTNGNGYICTIEAGNEPWKYPAEIYQKILLGVAKGAAEGDHAVEVFPCALQAADPSMEQTDVFKNYIGARITEETSSYLDGINIHSYSYVTNRFGKRRAVHPEHPASTFWEILNAIKWRNHNMPGKKIYLSEWGWDSDGGGEDCTHEECVSEQAAANYAVRGALIAARLGLERATWFFYANDKSPSSLYTRSGLCASGNQGYAIKKPYTALQSLVNLAGGAYFTKVLREDETAWIYEFGNKFGKPQFLIGWLPENESNSESRMVHFRTDHEIQAVYLLNGNNKKGNEVSFQVKSNGGYTIELSGVPTLMKLK